MARCPGDTWGVGRTRSTRAVACAVVLLAALLAGCGSGSDGDGAVPDDTSTSTTATTEPTSSTPTTSTPTTTEPSASPPEAMVKVPIDEELVIRLPRLYEADGFVSEEETFDERLCDGTKAPTVPVAQARATYELSDTEAITIAAYRFESGVGAYYLGVYTEAIRACAVEAGSRADLGLEDGVGTSFELKTDRGEAFMAIALQDDVLWVLFQEAIEGGPDVDPETLALFLEAVEG